MTSAQNHIGALFYCRVHGKKAYTKAGAKRAIRLSTEPHMRQYRCTETPNAFHIGHLPQATVYGLKTAAEVYGGRTLTPDRPAPIEPPAPPATDHLPDDYIAALLDMGDEEFDAIVREVAPDGEARDWKALLSPPLARRTRSSLNRLKTSLIPDLRRTKRTPETGALWNEVARRLNEANTAIKRHHDEHQDQVRQVDRHNAARLAIAIEAHRVASAGRAAQPHDLALWDLLDELAVVRSDGPKTLGDLIRAGIWGDKAEEAS